MFLPDQNIIEPSAEPKILSIGEGKRIIALGIQGPADTEFWINVNMDNITDKELLNSVIRVGKTGIYELDLTNGFGLITHLHVKQHATKSIIVDYLYEEEGGSTT